MDDPAARETLLAEVRALHRILEGIMQRMNRSTGCRYCAKCITICCREHICRESLKTPFLRGMLSAPVEDYDPERGWLRDDGCALSHGRPLVCYRFFCSPIPQTESRDAETLAKAVHAVYARARGNRHLMDIEDLSTVSVSKYARMRDRLTALVAAHSD